MNDDHNPFPGDWHWWASYDGGETLTVGPCDSRGELIELLLDDCHDEWEDEDGNWWLLAQIGEYRENNQGLGRWFDIERVLDDIAERMDNDGHGGDEYGDHHPLEDLTPAQKQDLEERIRDTIQRWQRAHGLKLRSYWYHESRNIEDVKLPHPEDVCPEYPMDSRSSKQNLKE